MQLNRTRLIKANMLNGSPQWFINFFAERLLKLKEDSTCYNLLSTYTDLTLFLFIRDDSFFCPEYVGTIPFPYDIPIQFNNYRLISMISSTERHRPYIFTRCSTLFYYLTQTDYNSTWYSTRLL